MSEQSTRKKRTLIYKATTILTGSILIKVDVDAQADEGEVEVEADMAIRQAFNTLRCTLPHPEHIHYISIFCNDVVHMEGYQP